MLCRVLKVIENIAADIPDDLKDDLTGRASIFVKNETVYLLATYSEHKLYIFVEKLQGRLATFKCSPDVIVGSMNALFKVGSLELLPSPDFRNRLIVVKNRLISINRINN